MARFYNIARAPSWIVILRCIHLRGAAQDEAFAELSRRGLWLSPEQKLQSQQVSS
jgi:hypothetical protein